MTNLSDLRTHTRAVVEDLDGPPAFMGRASAMGFTPGVDLIVVRNRRHYPVLVYLRDTLVAIDHKEAGRIVVHEMDR